MSGPYDSVLGMDKKVALNRYINQTAYRFIPATEDIHICGVSIDIDVVSGQALSIERFIYPEFCKNVIDN